MQVYDGRDKLAGWSVLVIMIIMIKGRGGMGDVDLGG